MTNLFGVLLPPLLCLIFASPLAAQSTRKGDAVPIDLVITLSLGGTIQFSSQYEYKISSNGRVRLKELSNGLPVANSYTLVLLRPGQTPLKQPRFKERVSGKRLHDLVAEFQAAGFYEMNDRYYGDPGLKENICINHAQEKGLSITVGGKTKRVSFFLGCSYSDQSPLKRFLVLYDKTLDALKGVKAIREKTPPVVRSIIE